MVLHEEVGATEKYVRIVLCVLGEYNSGEVCSRSDEGVRGEGGTAPRISFEPLFVCNGDG